MKPDMFLIIGLFVNVFFAVLYPGQIFGTEDFGLIGGTDSSMQNYFNVEGNVPIQYDSATGQIVTGNNLFSDLNRTITATEGDEGVFTFDAFAFVDWVKTGFNLIKTLLMFVVGFIWMLVNLVYPLNILIGIPFSLLYIYGIVGFLLGRI